MEEDIVEYASEEQVHQWSEEGEAEYVKHDEVSQAISEDLIRKTQEEDCGLPVDGWGPPNDGEDFNIDYNVATRENPAFSDGDRNDDDCETCNDSEEVLRVYCQNCDRPHVNLDQVCSYCDYNRG